LSGATLRRWWDIGLDLLFPPRCAGCGKVDTQWCASCQTELEAVVFPPLHALQFDSTHMMIATTGKHEGKLQKVIWSLKYEDAQYLAQILGKRLSQRLKQTGWAIDIMVPVPLHANRLYDRGYNQSQLIGDWIARDCGITMAPQAIIRQIDTRSQVGLSAQERQENMEDAFTADPLVRDKNLLLIDDVFTTGATLSACAQAALDAGARAVYGLTATMA
jgi:ComF family protein